MRYPRPATGKCTFGSPGSVIFVPACGIRPNAADGRHKSGETVEQAGLAAAGRRGTVRLNEHIHLPRLEQVSQVSRSREQPQCQFMRNCTELGYPPDGLEISRILDEGFFCEAHLPRQPGPRCDVHDLCRWNAS